VEGNADAETKEHASKRLKIERDLVCPICTQAFQIPYQIQCGHVFCRECLHGVLCGPEVSHCWENHHGSHNLLAHDSIKATVKEDAECPVCRKTILRVFHDVRVSRQVAEVEIVCPVPHCPKRFKPNEKDLAKAHQTTCQYAIIYKSLCHLDKLNESYDSAIELITLLTGYRRGYDSVLHYLHEVYEFFKKMRQLCATRSDAGGVVEFLDDFDLNPLGG
jgi:hypothetical protein